MFLTEQEAEKRLSRRENALTRLDRGDIRVPAIRDTPPNENASGLSREELEDFATGKKRIVPMDKVTFEQQALIGAAAQTHGVDVTATLFGMSPVSVRGIAAGKMLGKKEVDTALVEAIARQQRVIRDISYDKLFSILNLLDKDKIAALGKKEAKEIVAVADKLAGIFQKATPVVEEKGKSGAVFHVYQPEIKNVKEYKTVVVNSGEQQPQTSQEFIDGHTS